VWFQQQQQGSSAEDSSNALSLLVGLKDSRNKTDGLFLCAITERTGASTAYLVSLKVDNKNMNTKGDGNNSINKGDNDDISSSNKEADDNAKADDDGSSSNKDDDISSSTNKADDIGNDDNNSNNESSWQQRPVVKVHVAVPLVTGVKIDLLVSCCYLAPPSFIFLLLNPRSSSCYWYSFSPIGMDVSNALLFDSAKGDGIFSLHQDKGDTIYCQVNSLLTLW